MLCLQRLPRAALPSRGRHASPDYHEHARQWFLSVMVYLACLRPRELCLCDHLVSVQYLLPAPLFWATSGSVGFNNAGIDENQTIFNLVSKCIKNAFPDTTLTPSIVSVINSRVRSISFRKIAPRRTRSQYVENTIENLAVIFSLRTTPLFGQ